MSTAPELPSWDSLPVHSTDPRSHLRSFPVVLSPDVHLPSAGSCWMWGEDDELGRLNLLTDDRVAAAAQLIQTGQRVSLKCVVPHNSQTRRR